MEDNMGENEKDMILQALEGNKRLRFLFNEHVRLKEVIGRFEGRSYLTEQEKLEVKELKMKKLKGKEEMLKIAYESAEGF